MLTELRIQNFKSWRDTGAMHFAPLTGFFGPNSSGKSSLLQFLLLLKQTSESNQLSQVLELGYDKQRAYVNLGTFQDIIFQNRVSESLEFEFEWSLGSSRQVFNALNKIISFPTAPKEIRFKAKIHQEGNRHLMVDNFGYHFGSYYMGLQKEFPSLSPDYKFETDVAGVESLLGDEFDKRLAPIKFYGFPYGWVTNMPIPPLLSILLESFFQGVLYLGPLREYPNRSYLWSGEKPSDVGNRGERAVAALLDEYGIQNNVAKALKHLGLIYKIELREVRQDGSEYEVRIRQTETSPSVLLTQVGFGVSQVLPIVTLCYYAPEGSTIILEQPEIHLHPAVQAGLADVFIDVIKNRGVQIILESHSEHLLYRLQRRMAEEKLVPEDLALYFTHMENGESKLDELKLDEYGNISNWPDNFFGERMDDLIKMAEAAMRRQGVIEVNEA
ncbi:MAG: DUF3696 domain-containing protein [Caldilineaceae bacterium]